MGYGRWLGWEGNGGFGDHYEHSILYLPIGLRLVGFFLVPLVIVSRKPDGGKESGKVTRVTVITKDERHRDERWSLEPQGTDDAYGISLTFLMIVALISHSHHYSLTKETTIIDEEEDERRRHDQTGGQ